MQSEGMILNVGTAHYVFKTAQ